jgi:NAD(P)-dependent dehydrogenase (short-subunit alcohol dehydrogenase family)
MKGKVVLVTGANGGLGTYVTQAFLDGGATVVGTSRKIQQSDFNNPNFTALAAEISTRSRSRWALPAKRRPVERESAPGQAA